MSDPEDATDVEQVDATEAGQPEDVLAHQPEMDTWETVIEDMEATAAEYEDQGWETLQIHPGDVAVLGDHQGREGEEIAGSPGLDLIVPDDEFRLLADLLEDGFGVENVEVYRADEPDMAYIVTVMEDPDRETAVLAPAYYLHSDPDFQSTIETARDEGVFHTRLRQLTGNAVIIGHEDPELFAPDVPAETE
jgi:hypothetical protein